MASKPKRKPRPPDDPEQYKRFVEKARELGVDEEGKAFEHALKAVVVPAPAKKRAGS